MVSIKKKVTKLIKNLPTWKNNTKNKTIVNRNSNDANPPQINKNTSNEKNAAVESRHAVYYKINA